MKTQIIPHSPACLFGKDSVYLPHSVLATNAKITQHYMQPFTTRYYVT